MTVNAPPPQLIGQQYSQQRQHECLVLDGLRLSSSATSLNRRLGPAQASGHHFKFSEDASEIFNLVLTGGPKWGFRIKQLNDNRVIVSRVDKGAAEKCGLKVNDEILSVNNVQLNNSPRSLLLHDYPEQHKLLAAAAATIGLAASGDKTPLLGSAGAEQQASEQHQTDSARQATDNVATGAVDLAPSGSYLRSPVELSKLDFAYQLIKHSSASNKLVLTVKRFLNQSYARASVAAASSLVSWPAGASRTHGGQLAHFSGDTQEQFDTIKRPHMSAGYAYNCCDCYCDNEGEWRARVPPPPDRCRSSLAAHAKGYTHGRLTSSLARSLVCFNLI